MILSKGPELADLHGQLVLSGLESGERKSMLLESGSELLDPDILHCNASRDSWTCATSFRAIGHRAIRVRTKHNVKRIRRSIFNRFLYGGALSALVAPSPQVWKHLRSSPITARVPTRLVHYGIALEQFQGEPETRQLARQELLTRFPGVEDPLVAIYVSRMSARKHPDAAIHSVLRLARIRANNAASRHAIILVVVGSVETPTGQDCVAMAAHDRNVVFLGFRTDVPCVLAALDVFCMPSHYEGFGLALAEALAAGIPAVCTDVDSLPEVLGDA